MLSPSPLLEFKSEIKYNVDIVKISRKHLPNNCSRYARVYWLRCSFRYLYSGSNGGGTVINKTGIGAEFDFAS